MREYKDPVTGKTYPVIDSKGDVNRALNYRPEGPKGLLPWEDKPQRPDSVRDFPLPSFTRDQCLDMIRESEKNQTRALDVYESSEIPVIVQTLGYCWIFSGTNAVMVARQMQGKRFVLLSPASIGAIIKNYRDEGGWPDEGLAKAQEIGFCPADLWPLNGLKRSLDNEETRAARKEFGIDSTVDIKGGDTLQLLTACLSGWQPAVGRARFWGHAVHEHTPVLLGTNEIGLMHRNSWPGYGTDGHAVFSEKLLSGFEGATAVCSVEPVS